jgi:hypothetical protein
MKKQYFTISGTLEHIGDLVQLPRRNKDLYKRVLTIVSPDNQKLFPELRNHNLAALEHIAIGDFITIEFSFEGSEKNGKRYNNIFIYSINSI